jgi:hypothetical protein
MPPTFAILVREGAMLTAKPELGDNIVETRKWPFFISKVLTGKLEARTHG